MPPVYQIPHTDPKKHSKLEKYILYIFLVGIFIAIVIASYCYFIRPASAPLENNLSVATTSNIADISTWKTYRNDKYGFEMKLPPNWETEAMPSTYDDKGQPTGQLNQFWFTDPDSYRIFIAPLGKITLLSYDKIPTSTQAVSLNGIKARWRKFQNESGIYQIIVDQFSNNSILSPFEISFIAINARDYIDPHKVSLFSQILSTFKFISTSTSSGQVSTSTALNLKKDISIMDIFKPLFSYINWKSTIAKEYTGYVMARGDINGDYTTTLVNLNGYEIDSQSFDPEAMFKGTTNFTNYYDSKLKSMGWVRDIINEGDGAGSSIWSYKKDNYHIIFSYKTDFMGTDTSEGLPQCPCQATARIFAGWE